LLLVDGSNLLLAEFGTLEGIIQNAEKIKKPSIRGSIIRNTERLRRNYQLIKLKNKARYLSINIDEMKYQYDGITTSEILKGIGIR